MTKNRVINMSLALLDWVIPKDRRKVVFSGNGLRGLNGNCASVARRWHENQKTEGFKPYLLSLKNEGFAGFETVRPDSLKGLFTILRSYTAVVTHGPLDLYWKVLCNAKRRRVVNLWHGMPLKRVGPWDSSWFSVLISASKPERKVLSDATGMSVKRIFVTGYPRADDLINDLDYMRLEATKKLGMRNDERKWVLYAPTFRKDGSQYGYMHKLPDFVLEELTEILEKNNANMIFRPHPNDPVTDFPTHERIYRATFHDFKDIEPLYALADILITDYSSSVFEYVLLDRPIIGLASDYEGYSKSAGFLFDYRSNFPGPISRSWADLRRLLAESFANPDKHSQIRKKVRQTFQKFEDGNSTERVIELICNLSVR